MEVFKGGAQTRPFFVAAALKGIPSIGVVNKFGHAPDCDNGVATDIWGGADGVTSSDTWVPPTQARIHNLSSASTSDTSNGTGVRTVRVYGLTGWSTAETNEVVTMAGTSNAPTVNSYVIIHRMEALTWGSGGKAAGVIKATAATDNTITAMIAAGDNQTEMCIYGWPSTKTLVLGCYIISAYKGIPTTTIVYGDMLVMQNPAANAATNIGWTNKEHFSLTGEVPRERQYCIPLALVGPGIIKFQVVSSADNTNVTGQFDALLVNNT